MTLTIIALDFHEHEMFDFVFLPGTWMRPPHTQWGMFYTNLHDRILRMLPHSQVTVVGTEEWDRAWGKTEGFWASQLANKLTDMLEAIPEYVEGSMQRSRDNLHFATCDEWRARPENDGLWQLLIPWGSSL